MEVPILPPTSGPQTSHEPMSSSAASGSSVSSSPVSSSPVEPLEGQPQILMVCTGNICRSPAAELLLAAALGPHAGVRVASAGTHAVVGAPVHPPMANLLGAAGTPFGAFLARQLTAGLVRESALLIAMTRRHRGHVVELAPAAVRRTFTYRELARFADVVAPNLPAGTPAERLSALIPLAAAQRGRVPVDPGDDDIDDPYQRGDAAYARAFAQVSEATASLARALLG